MLKLNCVAEPEYSKAVGGPTQMTEHKKDTVVEAVEWMIRRDEEDNVINPGLNELESNLFLKIQSEQHNSSVGESIMSAFQTELSMELLKTVAAVAKKFELE